MDRSQAIGILRGASAAHRRLIRISPEAVADYESKRDETEVELEFLDHTDAGLTDEKRAPLSLARLRIRGAWQKIRTSPNTGGRHRSHGINAGPEGQEATNLK